MGGWAPSLTLFRGHFLRDLVAAGHRVHTAAAGADARTRAEIEELGVTYTELGLERTGMSLFADLAALSELTRLARSLRPDLLLAYNVKPVIYGGLAARRAGVERFHALVTGLGYAFLEHRRLSRRLVAALVRRLLRISLRGAHGVIFQNPDDLALFRERRLIPPRMATAQVAGSGVDVEHYAAVAPTVHPLTFLMMGRLLREKGVLEFAEAARRLHAGHPEVRFELLGPFDPHPNAIRPATVEAWQSEGFLDYLGTAADVRPHLARASVFVLPSYREGTPRSVLEAMSMARPVITSDAPGCRETVVHGHNGLLVPVGRADALAAAMERFIQDPVRIPAMGEAGRALAVERFDVRSVNRALFAALGLEPPPARENRSKTAGAGVP